MSMWANDSGKKVGSSQGRHMASVSAGSKDDLITKIDELTKNWLQRGGVEILEQAAEAIVASNRFGIDVVKELVIDSFFSRLSMNVSENDIGSVSMRVGALMGGPSFAKWLGENIVVGREPSQMMNDYLKYGRFGMWQEAKALCLKLGIKFTGPT